MPRIVVHLPANRDFAGILTVESSVGRRLAGPFAVGGRADDKLASRNGNPERNPLLLFGDTPIGKYRVAEIIPSGDGTPYPSSEFGTEGIILLEPEAGDAALADANGRFGIFIHGGAARRRSLCATEGSLRLTNTDLRQLIGILRQWTGTLWHCVVTEVKRPKRNAPAIAEPAKPPDDSNSHAALLPAYISRRSWLRTLLMSGASVTVPGAIVFTAQPAFGQAGTDYHQPAAGSGQSDFNGPAISGSGTTNSGNPAPPPPPAPPPAPPAQPNLTQQEYNQNSSSGTIPSPPPNNGLPPSPGVPHPYVPPAGVPHPYVPPVRPLPVP
jgi:hypothetical protein